MSKRNLWYEDDVVEYTTNGRLPKIPEKYRQCYYKLGKNWHTLKSFRVKTLAEAALKYKVQYNEAAFNSYKIFKCENCQQYHIMLKLNYQRYFGIDGRDYGTTYVCPIIKNKSK